MNRTPSGRPGLFTDILTLPNLLSLFRLCLIPRIVWLCCTELNFRHAGYLLILSGLTDVLDGFIARRFNMVSNLGKILDPIADKLTQAAVLVCLAVRHPLMLLPLSLMVIKELFMSITGVLVIRRTGTVYSAGWHGKAATCLLYAAMLLHIFWPDLPDTVSFFSVLACTVMVGISFLLYGICNMQTLKAYKKP